MTDRTDIYFDFEFIDDGREIVPISLGMCARPNKHRTGPFEDLYLEYQFDPARANDWVRENVFPRLKLGETRGTCGEKRSTAARLIREWVTEICGETNPQFIGYYPAYDWVCLCQHFGTMMQAPEGWPMRAVCLMQLADDLGVHKSSFPAQEDEHNALADARWNRSLHRLLLRCVRSS